MTTSQVLFLDRGPGRIAYEVTGAGPLVVCIPGMGDLRSTFRHLVPVLVAQGNRVATFDLRGHGDSDTTFDRFDDVAAATDALTLIEHLAPVEHLAPGENNGGRAVLVGNSMGAGAAVWAAVERPDLVAGLALLGPFVRDPGVDTAGGRLMGALMKAFFVALLARPWGPAAWRTYYATLFPSYKGDPAGGGADHAAHRNAINASLARPGRWRAFQKTTRTSHEPARVRLGAVHVPAVVVMGSKDRDFPDPAAEAAFIAGALGGPAEVVLVDGAGHYPQSEFPQVTGPAVAALVAQAHARA